MALSRELNQAFADSPWLFTKQPRRYQLSYMRGRLICILRDPGERAMAKEFQNPRASTHMKMHIWLQGTCLPHSEGLIWHLRITGSLVTSPVTIWFNDKISADSCHIFLHCTDQIRFFFTAQTFFRADLIVPFRVWELLWHGQSLRVDKKSIIKRQNQH